MADGKNEIPRISREDIRNDIRIDEIRIRKSEKEYKEELKWEMERMAEVIKEIDKSGIDNLKEVIIGGCDIIEIGYNALKDGIDLGDIAAAYKVVSRAIDISKVFDKAVGESKDLDPDEIGALTKISLERLLAIFVPGVGTENPITENLEIVLSNLEQISIEAKKALKDGLQWHDINAVIPIAVCTVKIVAALSDAVNEAKNISIKQIVEMIIKMSMSIINVIKS